MSSDILFHPITLILSGVLLVCVVVIGHLYRKLRKQKVPKYQAPIVKLNLPDPNDVLGFRHSEEEGETNSDTAQAQEAAVLNHETFHKFVPKQFVHHFAKAGKQQLELGQADEDEVAILFCDIRGFTGLSENMTPQELMNFLNSYFLRMSEPVHRNNGFIDKFIGDAIMSLFDHPGGDSSAKARDALQAAIDLRTSINIYNQHRSNSGYPPVNIGIGIHFGPVILGTVGSHVRMDTTVIGDSVNIAYRLETLTPIYQCDIIVSSQLFEAANAKEECAHRLLDWVRVKGKRNPVEIYEILAHLPQEEQDEKLSTAKHIEAGLEARKAQNWNQALQHFLKAQEKSPNDKAIDHHVNQCQFMQRSNIPEDWDGSITPSMVRNPH